MVIVITSLRLRKLWHFFMMSFLAMKITGQLRREKGFLKMKNTGFGYLHFTLTVWESEEDAKRFAHSGKHLEAMKSSKKISTEIRTYTFRDEQIPAWKDAKKLLFDKGKVFSFE